MQLVIPLVKLLRFSASCSLHFHAPPSAWRAYASHEMHACGAATHRAVIAVATGNAGRQSQKAFPKIMDDHAEHGHSDGDGAKHQEDKAVWITLRPCGHNRDEADDECN